MEQNEPTSHRENEINRQHLITLDEARGRRIVNIITSEVTSMAWLL